MTVDTTLQPTFDDAAAADDAPFSSRLRAVWLLGLPDSSHRTPSADDAWESAADHAGADLVEVTPAFAWVS